MSKTLWEGNYENLPEEYAELIVKVYNKKVDWRIENPNKWYTKEKYPRKYYKISEPFETYDYLPKRPYISQESETIDVCYKDETLWESFCLDEEGEIFLEFESKISRVYYQLYGDVYEPTGRIKIIKYDDY